MNRDDVIKMARESTAPEWWDEPATGWHMGLDLERFAQLVAAHERELCAKVCEEVGAYDYDDPSVTFVEAIRNRGNA